MRAKPEPAQDECKEPRLSPGAIAASLVSDWAGREPPFYKSDLSQLIHALGAGPVLSRSHRDQIAGLLHRIKDGHEPFERRRRSRGRPRKSVFNCQSVQAEHVAAEYVLALCLEGGWGAKPNALEKGMCWRNALLRNEPIWEAATRRLKRTVTTCGKRWTTIRSSGRCARETICMRWRFLTPTLLPRLSRPNWQQRFGLLLRKGSEVSLKRILQRRCKPNSMMRLLKPSY
jgi:hypothetical protein